MHSFVFSANAARQRPQAASLTSSMFTASAEARACNSKAASNSYRKYAAWPEMRDHGP